MKKITLKYLIILLAFFSLNFDIIDTLSVDNIKIGLKLEDCLEKIKKSRIVEKEIVNMEGEDYVIYYVSKGKELLYTIEPQCKNACTVWRIILYSKNFKTQKGIGIGSTLGELKKKYTLKKVIVGEGTVGILIKELKMSFLLETSKIPENWWFNQNMNQLNDNLKVSSIIIV